MGAHKCFKYASKHFYEISMRSDFKDYIRRCHFSQMNKQPTTLPDGVVTPLPVPRGPISSISIDIARHFPIKNKKELILIMLHCFTGFIYLIPVSQNITAVETANILIQQIFSVYGFPTSIVSDRELKLTSCFWMQFMADIKINLNMATAYYHETNGPIERRIRTICQCLRNFVNPKCLKWTRHLPHVQTAINAAPDDSSELSPFEMTFGRIINLLPGVKVQPTTVPSADDIASETIKNWQVARTGRKKARARQTTTSQKKKQRRITHYPRQN